MSERPAETSNSSETTEDVPYYLPAGPTLSREPGRIGRFVQKLLRRRGDLVPVEQSRGRD
ncbi:MAG: hypothetical protein V5A25_01680 [Halovenus sp.]